VIGGVRRAGGSRKERGVHFLKRQGGGAAMPVEQRLTAAASIKPAYERGRPQTDRSIFDGRAMKSPFSVGKSGWPKRVPRIANLADEPRRPKSSAKNRTLLLQPIVMPRMIAAMVQGR